MGDMQGWKEYWLASFPLVPPSITLFSHSITVVFLRSYSSDYRSSFSTPPRHAQCSPIMFVPSILKSYPVCFTPLVIVSTRLFSPFCGFIAFIVPDTSTPVRSSGDRTRSSATLVDSSPAVNQHRKMRQIVYRFGGGGVWGGYNRFTAILVGKLSAS